ncbi:MAG: hypothetical protein Kow0026_08490 [Oricola sp.]
MGWPWDAHVGQKVVFVKMPADWPRKSVAHGISIPAVGQVYTIRFIEAGEKLFFLLDEIWNSRGPWLLDNGSVVEDEPGFDAVLFKPLRSASDRSSEAVKALIGQFKSEPVPEDA